MIFKVTINAIALASMVYVGYTNTLIAETDDVTSNVEVQTPTEDTVRPKIRPNKPDLKSTQCLTEALYFEARSEGTHGQISVANVIMNRVKSDKFPNTVCEVINQPKQFSYESDGLPEIMHEKKAALIANDIATEFLYGNYEDNTNGATFYHTKDVSPYWSKIFSVVKEEKTHIFYVGK